MGRTTHSPDQAVRKWNCTTVNHTRTKVSSNQSDSFVAGDRCLVKPPAKSYHPPLPKTSSSASLTVNFHRCPDPPTASPRAGTRTSTAQPNCVCELVPSRTFRKLRHRPISHRAVPSRISGVTPYTSRRRAHEASVCSLFDSALGAMYHRSMRSPHHRAHGPIAHRTRREWHSKAIELAQPLNFTQRSTQTRQCQFKLLCAHAAIWLRTQC